MKATSRKNQKLIRQYPFLSAIFAEKLRPMAGDDGCQVDDLTIKVEIADGDLMYRMGNNYGLAPNTGCSVYTSGKFKGQVTKQGEYLFAVDESGRIINRVDWPNDSRERKANGTPYGYYALWKLREGCRALSNPLFDQTEYLVWVTVRTRHEDTKDLSQPFGRGLGRDLTVTIYKKPEIGFDELQQASSVWKNLVLTNNVLLEGYIDKIDELVEIQGSLIELAQILWDEVYDNGIQEIIDSDEKFKVTLSAQYGDIKFVAGEGICGYKGVTLEDANSLFALNQRPEANCFYVGQVYGTLPQIRRLVLTVVSHWNHVPGARDQLVRSR